MVLRTASGGNVPGRFGARAIYGGTGGSGPAVALRLASPINYYPSATYSYNLGTGATSVASGGWGQLLVGQDMTSVAIGIPMQYMAAGVGVKNFSNSLQIVGVALIYNGVNVQLTFGGQQGVTVADGSNIVSDTVASTAFGGAIKFTKGSSIAFKYQTLSPTGGITDKFPWINNVGGTALQVFFDTTKAQWTANTLTSTSLALTYSFINGGANGVDLKNGLNLPIILLGNHTNPAIIFLGDSKTRGTGDTSVNGAGGMTRALFSAAPLSTNIIYSGMNMGIPSGTTLETITAAGAPVSSMEFWWQYATHAVVGYGTNGFQFANQQALFTRLRANGIVTIVQRSLTPRTTPLNNMYVPVTSLTTDTVTTTVTGTMADTSGLINGQSYPISGATPTTYNGTFAITVVNGTTFTYTVGSIPASNATGTLLLDDQWRTTQYQIAQSGWSIGGGADTYEQSLRGVTATDNNYYYYQSTGERAGATLSTTAYWQWGVNGTIKYMTADGLHETSTGYELNVNTQGTVTSKTGGTIAQSLRQLIATF